MNDEILLLTKRLDEEDPLGRYRSEFFSAEEEMIYLDGNSLGRLTKKSRDEVLKQVDYYWGTRLIRSWNEDWYNKSFEAGELIANIAGARTGEVIVTDSTSVDLYKLAFAALKYQDTRKKIITDDANFPSDLYILQGLVEQFGSDYELVIVKTGLDFSNIQNQVIDAIDDQTALVSLSHVHFKSAYAYHTGEINKIAHEHGALVLWDLSHSIGAMPVRLNETDTDLAVGCTYKYLNGGPGSPAFIYIRKDLQEQLISPIWGWFGANNPFRFELDYSPAGDIKRFLSGTPPILSLAPMMHSLKMISEAGMNQVRKKSTEQSEFLISLVQKYLGSLGFEIASPLFPDLRGSHIALKHPEGYRICQALIDPDVEDIAIIPDFREPDLIRLGITPMYTTYADLGRCVVQLRNIVESGLFERYSEKRDQVT